MKTKQGHIVEVFEWQSDAAVESAHQDAKIGHDLWGKFAEVCDFANLTELDEAKEQFPNFDRVSIMQKGKSQSDHRKRKWEDKSTKTRHYKAEPNIQVTQGLYILQMFACPASYVLVPNT